jgi:hypothetical protein
MSQLERQSWLQSVRTFVQNRWDANIPYRRVSIGAKVLNGLGTEGNIP